jgi:hypothetical protein
MVAHFNMVALTNGETSQQAQNFKENSTLLTEQTSNLLVQQTHFF